MREMVNFISLTINSNRISIVQIRWVYKKIPIIDYYRFFFKIKCGLLLAKKETVLLKSTILLCTGVNAIRNTRRKTTITGIKLIVQRGQQTTTVLEPSIRTAGGKMEVRRESVGGRGICRDGQKGTSLIRGDQRSPQFELIAVVGRITTKTYYRCLHVY